MIFLIFGVTLFVFFAIYLYNRCSSNSSAFKFLNIISLPREKLKTSNEQKFWKQNLTYHCCESIKSDEKRPLLVLFAWLFAKDRHLDKYRHLYMQRGFDVLTVKIYVSDFMFPKRGSQVLAQNIVNFLNEKDSKYPTFIFHAFSVGAYQMGEVFVQLKKHENQSILGKTQQSLKGIVYDSAIDVNEAAIGLSKASTNNSLLQQFITTAMKTHLKLFYNYATKHYITSSNAIHNHYFRCPTLVLLSRNDVVANYDNTFKTINEWKQSGIEVFHKCWDNSPHVSHFFKYPQEYQYLIDNFLKNVNAI